MEPEVLVEHEDGLVIVTINRPAQRNAVNRAVSYGVCAAIDELDSRPDLRVGILTGAGGTFCSGMDLKAFLRGEVTRVEGRGILGIAQTPPRKPLIAAVEGWALAGGFELVLACDLVVASTSARFGVPEVKRSLVAAAGGALLLPQRIPRAVALEMLLTGDPIGAERAAEVGLINRLVDDGQAVDIAVELATRIAANGPLALIATKQIAAGGADWDGAEKWEKANALMAPVFGSQDAQEGARAFAEKRPPVWKGQ